MCFSAPCDVKVKWELIHAIFSVLTIYFKSVHMNHPKWCTWSCLLVYVPESLCALYFVSGQVCHLEICHSDSVRISWTAFQLASVAAMLVISIHRNQYHLHMLTITLVVPLAFLPSFLPILLSLPSSLFLCFCLSFSICTCVWE
jgi:Na+/melibiose symporter-like transporter